MSPAYIVDKKLNEWDNGLYTQQVIGIWAC